MSKLLKDSDNERSIENTPDTKINLQKRIIDTLKAPYKSTLATIGAALLTFTATLFASNYLVIENPDFPILYIIYKVIFSTMASVAVLIYVNALAYRANLDDQKIAVDNLTDEFSKQRELFFQDFVKHKAEMSALARRSKTFQIHGSPRNISKTLAARIGSAESVRNTFVDIRDIVSTKSGPDTDVTKAYENWLDNNSEHKWEDIVGIQEFFSNRYLSIKSSNSYKGQHQVFILKHAIPIINFMILDYADKRPSEVFFGWLPEVDDKKSTIFSTNDPRIYKMFDEYFEILKRRTWNDYFGGTEKKGFTIDYSLEEQDRIASSSDLLVDKKGLWITLSYLRNPKNNTLSVNRVGYLDIKPDFHGLEFQAKVYSKTGKLEEGETVHREIAHYLNNVFVGYRLEANNYTGTCHYKFVRYNYGEMLQGVYADPRDERRNIIIGERLSDSMNFSDINPDKREIENIIKKYDKKFRELPNFATIRHGPNIMDMK